MDTNFDKNETVFQYLERRNKERKELEKQLFEEAQRKKYEEIMNGGPMYHSMPCTPTPEQHRQRFLQEQITDLAMYMEYLRQQIFVEKTS